MPTRSLRLTLAALLSAAVPVALQAQSPADSAAIRQAALDYVEGFYSGDTLRLQRAIRPEFFKYGFFKAAPDQPYQGEQMTWPMIMEYTATVRQRARPVSPNARKDIQLLDVLDQTAAVKLTASWGIDYLLLAKYDGKWMISHVLWQQPPRPSAP